MKNRNVILTFIAVIFTSLIITSCEYETYVKIPISLPFSGKTGGLTQYNTTKCLADDANYQALKSQLTDDRDIVAATLRTVYDNVGSSAKINVDISSNSVTLLSRTITGAGNTPFSLNTYKQFPYIFILTPAERTAINTALKNGQCITGNISVTDLSSATYDFKVAIELIIGIKYKVSNN